jgi:hypothetical protein
MHLRISMSDPDSGDCILQPTWLAGVAAVAATQGCRRAAVPTAAGRTPAMLAQDGLPPALLRLACNCTQTANQHVNQRGSPWECMP